MIQFTNESNIAWGLCYSREGQLEFFIKEKDSSEVLCIPIKANMVDRLIVKLIEHKKAVENPQ